MQNSSYLQSKILTAPPQRLHLMLIEGAIRFGRQAEDALRRGDETAAAAPLLRVIDIVGELLAAVRGTKNELNKKVAELYWFLFRRVSEAKIHTDAAALAEALQLLEFERQTWQQVCEKLGNGTGPIAPPHAHSFGAGKLHGAKPGISLQA
jgi:flagellar secretion chaperone FliS